MYIYNVTTNVEDSIHEEWLQWIQNEYIPEVLSTGKFYKALVSRVQIEEEMGGTTYSIQYTTNSKESLEEFQQKFGEKISQSNTRFAGKTVSFATELDVVSELYQPEVS